MAEQLPLGGAALLLPTGFIARWQELQREHKTIVVLSDVTVTCRHIVVTVRGRERVGNRSAGDGAAADQIWAAALGRPS